MKKREYLNGLLIKSKDELIGRKIVHVDSHTNLIMYLDNGKILMTTINYDGWDNSTTIETDLSHLFGIINFGKESKESLKKYSNFDMEYYNTLIALEECNG